MNRTFVDSFLIKSLGYDDFKEVLEVEFRDGDIWQYKDVRPTTYNNLINSESIGRYFLHNIKGKYEGTKINN